MSVLSTLKKAGGCAGGVVIYNAAKAAASVANVARKKRKLNDKTKTLMKRYFPKVNLGKVRFRINSSLPANWFQSPDKTSAMTFGYTIYFKKSGIQKSKAGLALLMHELVHVDQVRRRGNSQRRFACDYGKGFLKGGSYRKNPMEVEAYDFVSNNPL